MSIRNMDVDIAVTHLNELFFLHKYDECVLFLNRLNHQTIKILVKQLSIDVYLSRLPYTIEIFDALYSKLFIIEPDNFPIRYLLPERLIDKMILYFSLLDNQMKLEPIDGFKIINSFENCIRIITYVQPNLYSRLLYFKYTIDKCLIKLEQRDFLQLNSILNILTPVTLTTSSSSAAVTSTTPMQTASIVSLSNIVNKKTKKDILKELHYNNNNGNEISNGNGITNQRTTTHLNNALIRLRATNLELCDCLKHELLKTIHNCTKASDKLNNYVKNIKTQKLFKDAFYYLKQQEQQQKKQQNSKKKEVESKNKGDKQANKQQQQQSEETQIGLSSESKKAICCQDYIQNRLFLNKSLINTIEIFINEIKLNKIIENLNEKINIDKEILLVYSHIKREEKYLNTYEPLQPLFRRYSLGYERVIQIWRKKCYGDTIVSLNKFLTHTASAQTLAAGGATPTTPFNKLNDYTSSSYFQFNNEYGAPNSSQRFLTPNPSIVIADQQQQQLTSYSSPDIKQEFEKSCSENNIFMNTNIIPTTYYTLPTKFKSGDKNYNSRIANELESNPSTMNVNEKLIKSISQRLSIDLPTTKPEESMNQIDKYEDTIDLQQKTINKLRRDLNAAKETIFRLRKNEDRLREKLGEKQNDGNDDFELYKNYIEYEDCEILTSADLIRMYASFYHVNRAKTFEALDQIQEIQNMNDFKTKLLFSVLVLSFRFVNLFLKDLKKKIRTLLQIDISDTANVTKTTVALTTTTAANTSENTTSSNNQDADADVDKDKSEATKIDNVPAVSLLSVSSSVTQAQTTTNQITNVNPLSNRRKTSEIIETSVNKYLRLKASKFNLDKIVEDVKVQLWSTLFDYPKLKECQDLNTYISDSVRLSWSLMNHEPPFKIDYSSNKYDKLMHERYFTSNKQNEQIVNYIWPTLIDTSDRTCLIKGIVIT